MGLRQKPVMFTNATGPEDRDHRAARNRHIDADRDQSAVGSALRSPAKHDTTGRMSDHEMYRRWVEGDQGAGDALVDAHWGRLYRYIARQAGDRARDVSQATWLAAQESRGYRGEGSFIAWMKTVANTQIRRRSNPHAAAAEQDSATSPSRMVLRLEAVAAVDDLSHEGLREAATAVWIDGKEPAEVAADTGVSENTIRSRLRLAKAKLRGRLS